MSEYPNDLEYDDDPDLFDGEELDDLGDDDADLIVADDFDDVDDSLDSIDSADSPDDEDDDYEDATPEEVDFVVAIYREDGQAVAIPLAKQYANDLDELIGQARRLPGDAGACVFVSISGEFFVIVRVRGQVVQVLLNDALASEDWPIARDVVDYLGMEFPDDEDDEGEPIGDFTILVDQGVSEFDMEAIASDYDEDSDELVRQIIALMKFSGPFEQAVAVD